MHNVRDTRTSHPAHPAMLSLLFYTCNGLPLVQVWGEGTVYVRRHALPASVHDWPNSSSSVNLNYHDTCSNALVSALFQSGAASFLH